MQDLLSRLEAETHRNGMWADTCLLLDEAAAALRRVEAERDGLEKVVTKAGEDLMAAAERNLNCIARATAAEARLAHVDSYQGEAEKIALTLARRFHGENYTYYFDAIKAALTSAFASGAESKWQDIATAPKDGSVIFVWSEAGRQRAYWGRPHCGTEPYGDPQWLASNSGIPLVDAPSQWHPLPAPPATGGEG